MRENVDYRSIIFIENSFRWQEYVCRFEKGSFHVICRQYHEL